MNELNRQRTESDLTSDRQTSQMDFWEIAVRSKWQIILCVLVAIGLSGLKYSVTETTYQSAVQLIIEKNQPALRMNALNPNVQHDVETQIFLIKSPEIVNRAVTDYDLLSIEWLKHEKDPILAIIKGLEGEHQEDTRGVVDFAFDGPNPRDCQKILNAIIATYGKYLDEIRKDASTNTLNLIARAKDEVHTKLQQVENKYRGFRSSAPPILEGKSRTNIHRQRLAEIETERVQIQLNNSKLKAEIRSIQAAVVQGADPAALAMMAGRKMLEESLDRDELGTQKLLPLLIKEQQLLEEFGYGPHHPQVTAIRKELALTRQYLKASGKDPENERRKESSEFVRVYTESKHQEIKANSERTAELDQLFDQEAKNVRQFLDIEAQDEAYRSEIKRMRSLFDVIVERLSDADLAEDTGGYRMDVIVPAGFGIIVAPSLLQHLAVGGFFGCLLGFALGFWRENVADRSFRSLEEVENYLRIRVAGQIPQMIAAKLHQPENSSIEPGICTYHTPLSVYAEAYRSVRVALFFSTQGERHKVIQVTSPLTGDGKSTLAANLAVSIANSKKSVLLVDCDFRCPRVAGLFGLDSDKGTPEVIRGETQLHDAVQKTEVENLFCMPCPVQPHDPAELLESIEFDELLRVVRAEYDYVVIDSPPLLAVTDASAIAARVDGVFMALRLTDDSKAITSRAVRTLNAVDANILGIVVNGVGQGAAYGSYGSGYGTAYGQIASQHKADIQAHLTS